MSRWSPDFTVRDGDRLYEYKWGDGMELHRRSTSLNEGAVMRQNAAIRSAGGAKPGEWQQPLFSLSPDQYEFLTRMFPALKSKDRKEQRRAWLRLAKDIDYYKLGLRDR